MIRCETLGPVRVMVSGRPAPPELLWRKHLALLVYLARSPRRTRSRSHLIGMLWPEKPEAAARHSLNEALRVLRRVVDGGVTTDGDQVALGEDVVGLDVDELERQLAAEQWEAAAGLVLGEFLEGFQISDATEFESWLAAEREIWRRRSTTALAHVAAAAASEGRLAEALSAAERAAALDPCSEQATMAVMKVLALSGRRADALARYEGYSVRVTRDLGAPPDREVVELAERIRRSHASSRALRVEVDPIRRPPLVGRGADVRALLRSWERVRSRRQSELVVLTGAQGFGRSRLIEEVKGRLGLERAVVLGIRAVPADELEPGNGVVHLAEGLADAPGVAGVAASSIGVLAARSRRWGERFPGTVPAEGRIGLAFLEAVSVVAEERPVAILVDDAHWLDEESLQALAASARSAAAAPVWILVATTPAVPRPTIDLLASQAGRDVPGAVVELGPLADQDIEQLVRWAFPGYDTTAVARMTRRIARDSAGIPLLVAELVAAVAAGMEPGVEVWPAPRRTLEQTMPGDLSPALVAAFRVSFRRLSDPAQRILAALAVAGGRVASARLGAIAELDETTAGEALDELEWARWVESEPRGYAFVARIARDVVLDDMLTAGQRRRLEARAAATG